MDINMIIVNNIQQQMKKQNIKQIDLAQKINVSKQIMSKMMSGGRTINAMELSLISKVLSVNMEKLVEVPKVQQETDTIMAFMGEVNTDEARKGLDISNKVANLILFHKKTLENGKDLMRKIEE